MGAISNFGCDRDSNLYFLFFQKSLDRDAMKNIKETVLVVLLLTIISFIVACGSSKVKANLPLEERMELATNLFEKKKYLNAKNNFRIITLSYSGSTIADKAQFYLAECHINMKEYILAASEYERLIKIYPSSEWIDDAKYKLGFCYYKLSPKYSLDQEYTHKAIREFQEFLEEYKTSDLIPEVEDKLRLSREKLAQKAYAAADQYRKMGYWDAAIIYYNLMLDKYYDSKFSPKAQFQLAECYRNDDQLDEALDAYTLFVSKFPDHAWIPRARDRMAKLGKKLKENKQKEKSDQGN